MKFLLWDHCSKASYLRDRMLFAGHEQAESFDDADLFLLDCDWRWAHPRPELIRTAAATGTKIATYPHGGLPTVFVYDGLTDPDPNVGLRLVHGPGSVEVADLLGLNLAQEAPGWLYSPTAPFQKVDKPKRVLFCPQHPNMDTIGKGNGHDQGPALNQPVYKRLLELGFDLTVTLVGSPWLSGVWQHPKATFVENPGMSFLTGYAEIVKADVVVAAGTMAAAAVAAGKPVVSIGQAQGDYSDWVDGSYQHPDHEDLYDSILRYPVDVADGDLADLIERVCAGDDEVEVWRRRFVGVDGTERALHLLERFAGEGNRRDVFIEGVTAIASSKGVT